jgi:hypothetical protein
LVSLLLKFGIFGIIGKFEFNSDLRISGDSHRQAMAAILGDDDSLGQEAAEEVVEDLKFDLQVLNAALKKLDADWNLTAIITPLLFYQGPALAVVPKLKRQIDLMTKLRDEFQKNRPNKCQSCKTNLQEKCRLPADAAELRMKHRRLQNKQLAV